MAVTAAASQENSLEIGLENKLEKLCEERQILIRREKKTFFPNAATQESSLSYHEITHAPTTKRLFLCRPTLSRLSYIQNTPTNVKILIVNI